MRDRFMLWGDRLPDIRLLIQITSGRTKADRTEGDA
jgi:hypothetical protein